MKKKLLTLLFMGVCGLSFGQFTTGTVTLDAATSMTIKIDTNATTATLTLVGPSTIWLGIGFGGTGMMSVSDMFIWNSTANRDYTPSGSQTMPSADASQSWTITSDTVSGVRTVVATRPLVSSGDYTFLNNSTSINIIWAQGGSTALSSGHSNRSSATLTRTALGVEDFSLNATSIYPNPSNGVFNIQTKTNLSTINVYSQVGAFVKTIQNTEGLNNLEINLKDLQSGVYLLELQNDTDKSWKKIVIE